MDNNVGMAMGINPARPVLQTVIVLIYSFICIYTVITLIFWLYLRVMVLEVNFVPDNDGENNKYSKCRVARKCNASE